jgi:hypothetical protein
MAVEVEVGVEVGANRMDNQGILSSLCPIHTIEMGSQEPPYGYRPIVAAILSRLGQSLQTE